MEATIKYKLNQVLCLHWYGQTEDGADNEVIYGYNAHLGYSNNLINSNDVCNA